MIHGTMGDGVHSAECRVDGSLEWPKPGGAFLGQRSSFGQSGRARLAGRPWAVGSGRWAVWAAAKRGQRCGTARLRDGRDVPAAGARDWRRGLRARVVRVVHHHPPIASSSGQPGACCLGALGGHGPAAWFAGLRARSGA